MFKKYNNIIAGAFFILVAVLVAMQIPAIRVMKVAMDSKLMPKICVALLITFGLILIIQGLFDIRRANKLSKLHQKVSADVAKKGADQEDKMPQWYGLLRVGLCLLSFAVFIALLKPVGFIGSGIFYLLSSFLVLAPNEKRKKPTIYILSVVVAIAVYFMFVNVFSIVLPVGTLW